jgi:hypothetical protein
MENVRDFFTGLLGVVDGDLARYLRPPPLLPCSSSRLGEASQACSSIRALDHDLLGACSVRTMVRIATVLPTLSISSATFLPL